MEARSFNIDTCREVVGDERLRELEAEGRDLADSNEPLPARQAPQGSYWTRVKYEMERKVLFQAYEKRKARIYRMTEKFPF